MYSNCIFCSAPLGANEAIETFPVGRQLAFDAWKGRLWAVCPACARWNLAPIDERWEAVESAEKLFRDAKLKVQSENVGLAQLPDGTRLVRVGSAVPGELAAWRYGRQLLRRRKRYFIAGGATLAGVALFYGGLAVMGLGAGSFVIGSSWWDSHRKQKVLYRHTEAGIIVRRWHVDGLNLDATAAGHQIAVHVRDAHRKKPSGWTNEVDRKSTDIVTVTGPAARTLLARAMVHVNAKGASRDSLTEANRLLMEAGSAETLLLDAALGGAALGNRAGRNSARLRGPGALAFEMALNEASERAALEGELAALEAAWREAEEIAAIADALPGEVLLDRLIERLSR